MANFGNTGDKKPNSHVRRTRGPAAPGAHHIPLMPPPAAHVEPRCKVCQCEFRREIDMMITSGWSQADVRRHWNARLSPDLDDAHGYFTKKNISIHSNKHLSIRDASTRKIIEARAKEVGIDLERAEGFLMTRSAAVELVIANALENMLGGSTYAEPKDILAAVAQLEKMEKDTREVAVDEMMRDYTAFADAVKELLAEVANTLGRDKAELMRELARLYERNLERDATAVLQLLPSSVEEIEEADYEVIENG